jgi:hypothetical protein
MLFDQIRAEFEAAKAKLFLGMSKHHSILQNFKSAKKRGKLRRSCDERD